jgi:chaperonin GroES
MDLNPLHDRVVVRVLEAEGLSAGGIVIPDAAKEKPNQGQVLAVGQGRPLENGTVIPVAVSVGDRVLFGQQTGHKIKVNGEELTILREEEILATIKE